MLLVGDNAAYAYSFFMLAVRALICMGLTLSISVYGSSASSISVGLIIDAYPLTTTVSFSEHGTSELPVYCFIKAYGSASTTGDGLVWKLSYLRERDD